MMSYTLTYHELCKDRRLLYRVYIVTSAYYIVFEGDGFDISRNVKCPFHGDDTPSAPIFDGDEDGLAGYTVMLADGSTQAMIILDSFKVNPAMYIRSFTVIPSWTLNRLYLV